MHIFIYGDSHLYINTKLSMDTYEKYSYYG